MCAADMTLVPPCLEGLDLHRCPEGRTGIAVTLNSLQPGWRIMPFRNRRDQVDAALTGVGYPALPETGRFHTAAGKLVCWAGQNCWLVIDQGAAGEGVARAVEGLAGLAAVSQAGGALAIRLEGARVEALMAKGCVLDLDRFKAGHCATTLMAHTRILLLRTGDRQFDLIIPSSHAASFWEWLALSAAEFGYRVSTKTAIGLDDSPADDAVSPPGSLAKTG